MKNPSAKDLRTPKYRLRIKLDKRYALIQMKPLIDDNGDEWHMVSMPKSWYEFAKRLRQRRSLVDK